MKSIIVSLMGWGMWREFVEFAEKGDEPFSAVCARFGVSRKTGYKWLNRFRAEGPAGLVEQSRRPKTSPRKTPEAVAELVLTLRRENPDWSAARISAELKEQGVVPLPAPSTIDLILRRNRVNAAALDVHSDAMRFEPNYRWTLRFGRSVKLAGGADQIPVWVSDDTTRFIVGLSLVARSNDEESIMEFLAQLFRRNGMPWRIALPAPRAHTAMTVWLMRVGLGVDFEPEGASEEDVERQQLASRLAGLPSYQRAALEDRMLKPDMLQPFYQSRGLTEKQAADLLDQIRDRQNFAGSQEAMQQRSPISLYRPGGRALPEKLPEVSYAPEAEVRLVSEKGIFTFQRRLVHVGRALAGWTVEIKATAMPDHYVVIFARQVLGQVDLSAAEIDGTTSVSLREA